jgi:hypothetical protein
VKKGLDKDFSLCDLMNYRKMHESQLYKKRETGRILNKNIGIVSALYRKRMLLNFEVCNRITLTMTYKYYKNLSADDLTV